MKRLWVVLKKKKEVERENKNIGHVWNTFWKLFWVFKNLKIKNLLDYNCTQIKELNEIIIRHNTFTKILKKKDKNKVALKTVREKS